MASQIYDTYILLIYSATYIKMLNNIEDFNVNKELNEYVIETERKK